VAGNFANSSVATAPSPATSGTSLTLASGDGSRFGIGRATAWPPDQEPTAANSEIVHISAVASDTLTIVRARESTTAKAIAAGWKIEQGVTAAEYNAFGLAIGKWITDPKYGAVADNSTDCTAAIAEAWADALADGVPLVIPGGALAYKITAEVDLRGHGSTIHAHGATIRQHTSNTQGILLGGTSQVVRGDLLVDYASAATSGHTNSNAIVFYAGFNGHYECLRAEACYRGFFLAQDTWADAPVPTVNTLFSCTFLTLRCNGYARSAIDFQTFGSAASTGNVILNAYTHNNYSGSAAACTAPPVVLADIDEGLIAQLNVEHTLPASGVSAVQMVRCRTLTVTAMHFEGVTLSGNAAFVRIFDQASLFVTGMHLTFCTITNDAGQKSVFHVGFTGTSPERIRVENLKVRSLTTTGVTAWGAVELYSGTTADVEIRGADTASFIGPWVVGDTYPSPMVKRVDTRDFTARWYTNPADLGWRAWSLDARNMSTTTWNPTAGTIYVARLRVPERLASGSTLTWVAYVSQAGTGGAMANCYAAVARQDTRARIGVSADQAANWNTIGGKEVALTLSAEKPEGVDLLAAILVGTQASTPVGFARGNALSSALNNGKLTAANSHFATSDTGASSVPATLATLTGSGISPYLAVY